MYMIRRVKTITIKLPLTVATAMEEHDEFTGKAVEAFLSRFVHTNFDLQPIEEFTYNQAFKISENVHAEVKAKAKFEGLAMNEYAGRLLAQFYRKGARS